MVGLAAVHACRLRGYFPDARCGGGRRRWQAMARVAQRGEIWLVDLGLAAKVRPCLVLSIAFRDDERAVVTYVPRTTALRGGRFEVPHRAPRFQPGAFDVQNINTVPVSRLINRLARVDDATLDQIESALVVWLQLDREEFE